MDTDKDAWGEQAAQDHPSPASMRNAGTYNTSDDLSSGCPTCGGQLNLMGRLGSRNHYRCRNCGADSSAPEAPMPQEQGY